MYGLFCGCGLNRVVGVHMYMTGCMSCSILVCMKLLVRRGTSRHKGVVIVKSSKSWDKSVGSQDVSQ